MKILFVILILQSVVFSNDKLYNSIDDFFSAGNYYEACKIVNKLYEANTYSYKANLYFGKCAAYIGDIDAAMSAYDRAEILNEEDSDIHTYLGNLYKKMGNEYIASQEYDKADRLKKHKFSVLGKFSVGMDDNIKYNAEIADMNDWFNTSAYNTSKESGSFSKEYLQINHTYNPNSDQGFYYKTRFHVYNKNYTNFHEDDFSLLSIYSGPEWILNSFDVWLPFSYTYTLIDYESFSERTSFNPQVRKIFDNKVLLNMEAEYAYKKYFQWEKGDKDIYFLGLSLSRWFDDNHVRIWYSYEETENTTSNSPRYFVDKSMHDLGINYTRKMMKSLEVGLGYLYSKIPYKDNVTITLNQKREDTGRKYSVYTAYDLSKNFGILLEYDYYENISNYTPSDYKKEVLTAGMYLYY